MVLIPGVARTWFGFHYQEQDKESEYYSFNVMHIDSERKDHGLLTQLHGSYEPYAHWDFDFGQEIVDVVKFLQLCEPVPILLNVQVFT